MVTKYLYLDDEEQNQVNPHIDRIQLTRKIMIELMHPSSFQMEISNLIDRLYNYDGFILDWRLDQIPSVEGVRFPFRAAALAQEIRTRTTEKTAKGIPIVLWSTENKLSKSYYGDETSQDLFDYVFNKEQISDNPEPIRIKMISLANGYKRIREIIMKGRNSLSNLLKAPSDILDVRIVNRFTNNDYPIHEYVSFILHELIERPGPLISEDLLAARLGVDRADSSDWNKLLKKLPQKSRYQGPFYDAWPRWWAQVIEREWWRSLKKNNPSLSTLPAHKRIEILKEKTNLYDLITARPLRDGYDTKYYTLCEYYQKPLDPTDGVIIDEKEPAPWQERRYISIDAALERKGEPNKKPHPTEIERVNHLRGSRYKDGE